MSRIRLPTCVFFTTIIISITFSQAAPHNLYVSPTGDDTAIGTLTAPLRTFYGAQDRVRQFHQQGVTGAISVYFRDGQYVFDKTAVLNLTDTGRENAPVTYSSYGQERAEFIASTKIIGWREVMSSDPGYYQIPEGSRKYVMVAKLPNNVPGTIRYLQDRALLTLHPSQRSFTVSPNTNAVYGLATLKGNSTRVIYLGDTSSLEACQSRAVELAEARAYTWHTDDFPGDWRHGCYARIDSHGSASMEAQDSITSGRISRDKWLSLAAVDVTDWVTTQHRCPGAECEQFDPPSTKKTMDLSVDITKIVGNEPEALEIRAYLTDFNMELLPVDKVLVNRNGSTVHTSVPATYRLGQKPGYCDESDPDRMCFPSIWIQNTMNFVEPGQWAVNPVKRLVYYWPSSQKETLDVHAPYTTQLIRIEGKSVDSVVGDVPVSDIIFRNLTFTGADRAQWDNDDDGGVQHNWAALDKANSLVQLRGALRIQILSCIFAHSGGCGLRMDLTAQNNAVIGNTFHHLGLEAVGFYGYGGGLKDVNGYNTLSQNDISFNAQDKFDSPAVVLWHTGNNLVENNYIHNTPSKALYMGGTRYCIKEAGKVTRDAGFKMNRWTEMKWSTNSTITKICSRSTVPSQFKQDCGCGAFRHTRGNRIQGNVLHRIGELRDRWHFADGAVYISGTGLVSVASDINQMTDNIFINSPKFGPGINEILYVDGYTGDFIFERNAFISFPDTGAWQVLCNWYGHLLNEANVISNVNSGMQINCDGNPVVTVKGNLILDNPSDEHNDPEKSMVDSYKQVYENVCMPTASVPSSILPNAANAFLRTLHTQITKLGGHVKVCY